MAFFLFRVDHQLYVIDLALRVALDKDALHKLAAGVGGYAEGKNGVGIDLRIFQHMCRGVGGAFFARHAVDKHGECIRALGYDPKEEITLS